MYSFTIGPLLVHRVQLVQLFLAAMLEQYSNDNARKLCYNIDYQNRCRKTVKSSLNFDTIIESVLPQHFLPRLNSCKKKMPTSVLAANIAN